MASRHRGVARWAGGVIELRGPANVDRALTADPKVERISGFPLLASAGGRAITDNPALRVVDGFAALTDLQGDLVFHDNDAITTLSAFPALVGVEGQVQVRDNGALTDVSGFAALRSSAGLEVRANPMLTTIDALDALEVVLGRRS